jgi:hypothetical protein
MTTLVPKYDLAVTNAVNRPFNEKLNEVISVDDFIPSGTNTASTDCSTYIQNAINYAGSIGGAIVTLSAKVYVVSQLTFGANSNVILQGNTQGYTYGNAKSTSVLQCTTGIWAIRFPELGSYCGLQDLAIQSNGIVNTASPYLITTAGVEYGILIETGSTTIRRVTVYGFQYGCTIAAAANSNIFDECGFVWNTKVGFAVLQGGAAAYAVYHPNLTYTGTIADSTVYTMRNCNLRRNAWGMVLRAGGGTFQNVLCESNIFGGLIEWAGSVDGISGGGGDFYNCYFEDNWISFDPASINWNTASVQGNNYLKNTVSTYITLVDNANNALSDFGYQLTMGSETAGTAAQGPSYQLFSKTACITPGQQKTLFLKQGYLNKFDYLSSPSGTVPANAIRLGQTVGSFSATGTQFFQSNVTLPTDYSNRGIAFASDLSSSGGGLTMKQGFHRGLAGNISAFATPTPVTITAASYNAAAKPFESSWIANFAGTVTITFRPANETTYTGNAVYTGVSTTNAGRWLYLKTVTANAVISASADVVPINGTAAGTAILPATAGAWAMLQSDGTNWIVMARGT